MVDFGGIPEDSDVAAGGMRSKEDLQVDMVFKLDPLKAFEEEKGSPKSRQTFGGDGDDPMWSSSSSMPEDWFFTGE